MIREQKKHQHNRSYFKHIFALILCCVLILSNIPFVAMAKTSTNRTVKAGVFFFDGYHMRDSDGNYTGYGIDLLNLISQYSHVNFEYAGYDKSWEDMLDMLESGEIDMVTTARKTKQRAEDFGFSLPIERNSTVLSIQEQNTIIRSGDYSTYNGMTVGVVSGSTQNKCLPKFANQNGFTYHVREYNDSRKMEADLQDGTIDAILTSNLRKSENEKILDTLETDYFYAITRKDDQELLDEINYAINQMNINEGDWANTLYYKYYGNVNTSSETLTPREDDYIHAVFFGKKHITATSMIDRKPFSYVEDGKLKGILPEYFDSIMKKAGLSYEMIVPKNKKEYEQFRNNGEVDVVVDWQQLASAEKDYTDNGFFTDSYMNAGTSLLTRKDFTGSITALAVTEGQENLPSQHESLKKAKILSYPTPEATLQAVLDKKADAAFVRTYSAQYFVNNDPSDSLQFSMIDFKQLKFNMFVSNKSDHELVTILNKYIHQTPDDVLNQLVTKYTSGTPENITLISYMSAHPEIIFLLLTLIILAIGITLFFYLRARWNNKLLRTTEQSKQEMEKQLAIVSALSRDYLNVYTVNLQKASVRIVKMEGYLIPGLDRKNKEAYPYSETLRTYIDNRVMEEDKDYLREALSLEHVREMLAENPEYIGTYHVKIGEEIHNYQFTYVLYQKEGQTDPLVLAGFRNIDDIVRKEQQQKAILEDALHMAQAASEAKTSFLSSVSHDIRTPMNAIIGFLALIQEEVDNPDLVKEYAHRIDAASQHLLGLINDVLDMNKIESGSTTLNVVEMNLAEVIDEINTIIRPQTKAKKQTFDIFASNLNFEHLMGDKMRINQVLINLLSNSVKYTPEKGTIVMRVDELPQVVENYSRIRFTISDNGLGMSDDFQKVIFEPFTREDTKVTHEIQGTGLGMAITKSLVDLMGGSIKVNSKFGEGSTFMVELELPIQEREDNPKFWVDHSLRKMLVVDDDEEICQNIVHTMRETGVIVEYATGGEAAVRMMEDARQAGKPYDLVLLDWKMPELDGLETAQLIREKYPEKIPILFLTAYDWSEIEQKAIDIGVDHFMAKPFFISTFKEAICHVVDDPQQTAENMESAVNGKHILVVDDIEANLFILMKILSSHGAICESVENGQEAVDAFLNSEPGTYDLILMDVQMPIMNGYDATRTIRASSHPEAKDIPIIAMTANAFVDDVRDAINAGMDAHITKPVQLDKLKSTIRHVLDSRKEKGDNSSEVG